jgi:hypothetical protein
VTDLVLIYESVTYESLRTNGERRLLPIELNSLSLSLILWPTASRPVCLGIKHPLNSQVKVKVKVTLRLTVSQSVSLGVEPILGLMTRHLLLSCYCGAPSLTRGRVCLLYMLLALASAFFLGSESLWTRYHTLLSQIRDFPFRRLLRLAG